MYKLDLWTHFAFVCSCNSQWARAVRLICGQDTAYFHYALQATRNNHFFTLMMFSCRPPDCRSYNFITWECMHGGQDGRGAIWISQKEGREKNEWRQTEPRALKLLLRFYCLQPTARPKLARGLKRRRRIQKIPCSQRAMERAQLHVTDNRRK